MWREKKREKNTAWELAAYSSQRKASYNGLNSQSAVADKLGALLFSKCIL